MDKNANGGSTTIRTMQTAEEREKLQKHKEQILKERDEDLKKRQEKNKIGKRDLEFAAKIRTR